MSKKPALPLITGAEIVAFRKKHHLNQAAFWNPLGVTQSGGSRYEGGRNIPAPVMLLVALRMGSKIQKKAALRALGFAGQIRDAVNDVADAEQADQQKKAA